MKSKFLLPAFAIVFAIVLSSFTVNELDPAYYNAGQGIESTTEYSCPGGSEDCTIFKNGADRQLYSSQILIPANKLYKN
tara:strand:- start:621 stop:857 length:237 start_codon:yes stop_codon:yes gene_type:complete